MSELPEQVTDDTLVGRLRAAGCVYAEDEARLLREAARDSADRLAELTSRRVAGEPLEHVVGWAEFAGLRIGVQPGVFVPRRRTECLATAAVGALLDARQRGGTAGVLLDLCCGAGPVGVVAAHRLPDLQVYGVDVEPAAVRCARANLAPYRATVLEGDLYAPLPRGLASRVDVITTCAPCAPSASIAFLPSDARDHEPRPALDGGPDGLDVLRRVVAGAAAWLAADGVLLMEVAAGQVDTLSSVAATAGFDCEMIDCPEVDGRVLSCTSTTRGS